MEKIFENNKEFKIFGTLLICSVLVFSFVIAYLLKNKSEVEAKLELNKEIIEKSDRLSILSKKWQEIEWVIVEKRDLIESEKNKLELLEKNKTDIEWEIHSIRAEILK